MKFINYFIGLIKVLIKTRSLAAAFTCLISPEGDIGRNTHMRFVKANGEFKISDGCRLNSTTLSGKISIGRYTSINGPGVAILSKKSYVKIGSFCSIARNVLIQEYNHDHLRPSSYFMLSRFFGHSIVDDVTSKGPVEIGDDVWIGANSVILSGVKIGNGAIIAAGAIVTKDIPAYTIAGGIPAKVIAPRYSENQITKIIKDDWYSWSLKKILENKEYFANPLKTT